MKRCSYLGVGTTLCSPKPLRRRTPPTSRCNSLLEGRISAGEPWRVCVRAAPARALNSIFVHISVNLYYQHTKLYVLLCKIHIQCESCVPPCCTRAAVPERASHVLMRARRASGRFFRGLDGPWTPRKNLPVSSRRCSSTPGPRAACSTVPGAVPIAAAARVTGLLTTCMHSQYPMISFHNPGIICIGIPYACKSYACTDLLCL